MIKFNGTHITDIHGVRRFLWKHVSNKNLSQFIPYDIWKTLQDLCIYISYITKPWRRIAFTKLNKQTKTRNMFFFTINNHKHKRHSPTECRQCRLCFPKDLSWRRNKTNQTNIVASLYRKLFTRKQQWSGTISKTYNWVTPK